MSDQPTETDETVAVDNDVEQPESGAPADDEQETAVDAFVAGDEDDAPAGDTAAEKTSDGQ